MKIKILILSIISLFLLSSCSQTVEKGTLEFYLTDAPGNFTINEALVTISKIQVNKASDNNSNESGWITIIENEFTYDLIELIDVSTVIGNSDLDVGKYNQVRLSVDKAVITVDDIVYDLKVPSNKIKLTKGFTIENNKTTKLTLDFDIKESITRTGNDKFILKPTIKIIEG